MTLAVLNTTAQFSKVVERPKAEGYNIRVAGTWYRTIASPQTPIQIGTRDSLAVRQEDTGSVYNNVLDIGYAWGRTDVSGGEGLDWDPREIALERDQVALDLIRYWDSEGINIARPDSDGEQYTIRLARTFTDSLISVTAPIDIGVSTTRIYIADGQIVTSYANWSGSDPVPSVGLPALGIVSMAVAPNDTVMVVMDDGSVWHKPPLTTTYSSIYTSTPATQDDAKGVWYTNGRFIMSAYDDVDSSQLWELVWDGTDWIPDIAFDSATSPFWSVVESGPAIVAACGDGTVRTYTPDNQGGDGSFALIPRARTTMPHGESPILLGSNAGVLLIMTTADVDAVDRQEVRIYRAEVLDARFDYSVGQIQLIREHFATEHEGNVNRYMTNTRDEIFFLVKEKVKSTEHTFEIFLEALWRYDLVTGGLSRLIYEQIVPNSGDPQMDPIQSEQTNLNAIVIFDNLVGAIDFTAPRIRISDPDLHQAFGYMIFPNITFGLNTPITWIATVVEAHNLTESGGQVELWRSANPQAILDWNDPSWILVQRLSSQNASNLEIPFANLRTRTLSLQLRIKATEAGTKTPHVTRVALRGIPAHRDLIMMVPFNISDYVSVPGRKPSHVPGLGNALHQQVLDLVGSNVEAIMLDPSIGFRGVVNNVSEPVTYQSRRGSVTTYVMVEFRGQRLTSTAPPTGDSGMGLGLMGVATIGIGQTGIL